MQTFEDLDVWAMAAELAERIGRQRGLSRNGDGLGSQIRRASQSIVYNIAEGWGRRGEVELNRFLVIAQGSCAEVQAQLRMAYRTGSLARQDFLDLIELAQRVGWMLRGFIRRLQPPR